MTVTTEPVAEPVAEPTGPDFDFSTIQLEETEDEAPVVPRASKEPRKDKDTGTSKSKAPLPRYREGQYVKPVMTFYGWMAMGIGMTGDQTCADAIMKSGEQCAIAWDALAKENHAVRRMLATLTEGGMWAGLAVAHLPIAVAVGAHHGKVPAALAEMFLSQNEEPAHEEE